jgi:hypothetical protein
MTNGDPADRDRRPPEAVTDDELLRRIAEKDPSKFDLPEIARNALEYDVDGSGSGE